MRIERLLSLPALAVFALLAGATVAQAADDALITKGEYLARAGDCIACHTNPGGALFAGGRPMATPFGTIYTSNITPDPTTGIGSSTADQFYGTMSPPVTLAPQPPRSPDNAAAAIVSAG